MPDRGDDAKAAPQQSLLSALNSVKELVAVAGLAVGLVVGWAHIQDTQSQQSEKIVELTSRLEVVSTRYEDLANRMKTVEDNVPSALAAVNAHFANDEANASNQHVTDQGSIKTLSDTTTSATAQLQSEIHDLVASINLLANQVTDILATLKYLGSVNPSDARHVR